MSWGILGPITMFTVGPVCWAFTTWVRARHGYPLDDKGNRYTSDRLPDARTIDLLTTENGRLNGQVVRLEERIAVLERIATDPSARLASEIDALRMTRSESHVQ